MTHISVSSSISIKKKIKSHYNCSNRLVEYARYTNLLLRRQNCFLSLFLIFFVFLFLNIMLYKVVVWVRGNEWINTSPTRLNAIAFFFNILLLRHFLYLLFNFPVLIHAFTHSRHVDDDVVDNRAYSFLNVSEYIVNVRLERWRICCFKNTHSASHSTFTTIHSTCIRKVSTFSILRMYYLTLPTQRTAPEHHSN